jgi:hypothetical protein
MRPLTTLATLVLVTATNYASAGATIPPTAKNIGVIIGRSSAGDASQARSGALQSAEAQISNEMNEFNVEYECRAVYREWDSSTESSRGGVNCQYFLGMDMCSGTAYDASVTISVFCDPRGFQEKVAISAEKACEKDPKPECMSRQYLDMFSKIKNTAYYDINRP